MISMSVSNRFAMRNPDERDTRLDSDDRHDVDDANEGEDENLSQLTAHQQNILNMVQAFIKDPIGFSSSSSNFSNTVAGNSGNNGDAVNTSRISSTPPLTPLLGSANQTT
jgi:hypothetical protein